MNQLPEPDLLGTLLGYLQMAPTSLLHNLGRLLGVLL